MGKPVPPPDPRFLESAWSALAAAAAKAKVAVVLGTERVADDALLITALVINRGGGIDGFQDKVQLDPSEEGTYSAGSGRRVFQTGPLTFGVVICHEGWRYPETVRWAARQGAHIVFHPPTLSTRKQRCAVPPRTPAISQPSTFRATGRRPLRHL
jgi:predicted amidohydrolase